MSTVSVMAALSCYCIDLSTNRSISAITVGAILTLQLHQYKNCMTQASVQTQPRNERYYILGSSSSGLLRHVILYLQMETAWSSETSVSYDNIMRCQNPEEFDLNLHSRESLKTLMDSLVWPKGKVVLGVSPTADGNKRRERFQPWPYEHTHTCVCVWGGGL